MKTTVFPSAQDAEAAFLWIRQFNKETAKAWYEGLLEVIFSLEELPYRCSLAPESKILGREVRQLISEGKPIINMGIGSPDLAPHSSVIEAINKAMFDEKAHEYQSYQGLPELRQEMATFYDVNFGVSKALNLEFLPLLGSKEGIMHISMAFLNEGDEVLIPAPYWVSYPTMVELASWIARTA